MVGDQIGTYRIERKLGEGGMGVVWVGVDVRLGRRAAVKQLLPDLSKHREIVERFFNEARAAAQIDHPGIVEIYDVGWHTDESAYFAMKMLDGKSLASRVGAPMPEPVVAAIGRQVASALGAAHAAGIVHRDLKPDNVIMVRDDETTIGERAVVVDFGIAKLVGDQPGARRTRTGTVMGTPYYMSPEQCRGAGEVDHRTDVYALGCMLFEMLTGRPPFVAEGAGAIMGMHQFVDAPRARSVQPGISLGFDDVLARMLAKNADGRPARMSDVTDALQPLTGRATARSAAASPPRAPAAILPMASTLSNGRGEVAGASRSGRRPLLLVGTALGLAVIAAGIALAVSAKDRASHVAASPPSVLAAIDAAPAPVATSIVAISIDAGAAPDAVGDEALDASVPFKKIDGKPRPARARAPADHAPKPDGCSQAAFSPIYNGKPVRSTVVAALKRLRRCRDEGAIDAAMYDQVQLALMRHL